MHLDWQYFQVFIGHEPEHRDWHLQVHWVQRQTRRPSEAVPAPAAGHAADQQFRPTFLTVDMARTGASFKTDGTPPTYPSCIKSHAFLRTCMLDSDVANGCRKRFVTPYNILGLKTAPPPRHKNRGHGPPWQLPFSPRPTRKLF
jgi:hypothetical protein